jgi:hypothetical protein
VTLGAAIPPPSSSQLASVAESALDAWLRERSDTLIVIQEILRSQEQTQAALAEIVRTLNGAVRDLAMAASGLSTRVEQPAPIVNVSVPEKDPVVNVTVEAAPVHVEVIEPEEPEKPEKPEKKSREVTTIERDAEGRIVRAITEEVE